LSGSRLGVEDLDGRVVQRVVRKIVTVRLSGSRLGVEDLDGRVVSRVVRKIVTVRFVRRRGSVSRMLTVAWFRGWRGTT
jgi:hypothetical protein